MKPGLTIVIPVFNEENTLRTILDRTCRALPADSELLVIEDGSTDSSPEIIKQFLDSHPETPVRAIYHEKNLGKGSALRTGIQNANHEYLVVQDADLEYDPNDLVPMHKELQVNDYNVIYGSRFLGSISGMARPNFYANRFYNFTLRRLYPTDITDMHTCYKMVRTQLLRELELTSTGFEYASELISKLLLRGEVIHELPISFEGRTKDEGKKIDFKDGIRCLTTLTRYRFGKKT